MATLPHADVGVFGGSGFYNMFTDAESVWVETPYGAPSDKITIATVGDKKVAFLPRHGSDHRYPPALVPYRANLWAFKKLGVKKIFAPCAVGSLQSDIKPGDFVICDQFVDRTYARPDTFYTGPIVAHVSTADPYCPSMRLKAVEAAKQLGINVHPEGTMVIIQGPRFSTRAESQWFTKMGWSVVGMTGYPECVLARELEMCYVNISLVTDYDAGIQGVIEAVSMDEVVRVFAANIEKVKSLLFKVIESVDANEDCTCMHALDGTPNNLLAGM